MDFQSCSPACSAWPGPTPQFLVGAVFQQNDPQLLKRITPILIANLSRRFPSCDQEYPPTLLDDSHFALPFLAEL